MSRQQVKFNGSAKRKPKRPNRPDDFIPLHEVSSDPDPDYGESVRPKPSDRNKISATNKAFGASSKPDYDSDPEPDYRETKKPTKIPPSVESPKPKTAHKTGYKPVGGVQLFPSSMSDSNGAKKPHSDTKPHSETKPYSETQPQKSTVKSESPVVGARVSLHRQTSSTPEDDPLMLQDLAKLSELSLDTISDCIEKRYKQDLIYTRCGEILISVNPFKEIELCTPNYFSEYNETQISNTSHLFAVSAKAYQGVRTLKQNQVILVSGESGAGKTEATKLLVRHLMSIAGSEYETLQDRIIEVNPLLEAFGNAKTILNNNSSRFAKFLSLNISDSGKIESARIKDYMLEKSRVVHQEARERNFHAFYAFLVGASDDTLESVFINRFTKFRIVGECSSFSAADKQHYQDIYHSQQTIFKLIKLNEEEVQDINIILAAVLHLCDIEFVDSDNDCVVIKDEVLIHTAAALLQVDVTELIKIFLERSAKVGKNASPITMSKNKKQAEDERDATAKALYERMFGWLVRKINDALKAEKYRNLPSIGILDICGFENLAVNSFEQLCINLVNEQLQNFMNKTIIEDERELYLKEGVEISDVDVAGINNDAVLHMFMQKKFGILDIIDEDTKSGLSSDEKLVFKLTSMFARGGIFISPANNTPEFSIKHFAGKVTYNAESFIKKNMDTLSENMVNCLKSSESTLIQDLFLAPETTTGSISMANFNFRGSKRPSTKFKRPVTVSSLSESINRSRKSFGQKSPNTQFRDFSNHSTHVKFFRNSLEELQKAMREADPFFVRCIKPNDKQKAGEFWRDRVKTQLLYNGVKEIARIRTCGFPFRYLKDNFKKSYEKLASIHSGPDPVQNIFRAVQADKLHFKIGKTQIFMKESVKLALDDALAELKRKEEEERRRKEEEERRLKEEAEKRKKEEEKLKLAKAMFDSQTSEPLGSFLKTTSLETIAEVSTPASLTDDSVYNKPQGSSSSKESMLPTTEESSEEESEDEQETSAVEEKPEEEKVNAAWDITQELTEEEERRDVHEQPFLMLLKFIIYILLFLVILSTFVISKVSFLLLVNGTLRNNTRTSTGRPRKLDPETVKNVCYVLLMLAICVPHALGWLVTVAKLCFGNFKRPSLVTWIWVFVIENLHTVGLCLLVFRILNHLTIIKSAILLSATAIIPAILKITMSSSDSNYEGRTCLRCESRGVGRKILRGIMDTLAMFAQISVIPLVIIMDFQPEKDSHLPNHWRIAELVASFILISFSHWENFTDGKFFCELGETNWFKNTVLKIRYDLQMGRHYPHLITFLWKIGLTILLGYLLSDNSNIYKDGFDKMYLNKNNLELKDVSVIIALTLAAFVSFYISFGACMFQMQVVSLTIPAYLATPAVIGLFYLNCEYKFLESVTNLDAQCPEDLTNDHWYYFLFGAAWWLSLLIVTRHMWRPQADRTANMARVFLTPNYCGILTAESIMLNRRRNPCRVYEDPKVNDFGEVLVVHYKLRGMNKLNEDEDDDDHVDKDEEVGKANAQPPIEVKKNEPHPATPTLYACATMWHETRTEMVQLLKSLHRLDRDQFIRRIANEKVQGYDPEFYNFEAHIFFDDAMEPDDNDEQVPNQWVKELVACMGVACSSVHGKPMKVHPPTKVPTPYGGQLIWQMPGENLLFVHMKDIKKIRNRKRWSQVMYMYYLLGYRHIMASKKDLLEKLKEINRIQGNHGLNISEINQLLGEESALKAQNTFILALDGDTDFSPGAIKILLDRMKDENVGAACGRIHPIGNGPMVWYQKFEYAIGHWLQKSAEHVLGCVLCSPGCFSLFRAAALMDTNVMKKYTTEPTEPGHHLQYDQGEDRWLCTLMLQQGYRIEYAAAADAWTFAPEGFFEFFNQRRRWMPSTIANILDLLGSASLTTKRNANMSKLYIGYQWLLMLMTVLGPGTILMMIAGAVKLVFRFTLVEAYLFATIPAAAYTVACFWFRSRIQLIFAAILSVTYTFIMMIVFVGTVITVTKENIFHPSVVVIVMLVGIFIIAGICHPQEIWCLLHGILYLLTIPSGYLLLVIYSICNLNDVSWGTREVPTKAQRLEMEKKKKEKEEQEKNKPKKGFLTKLFNRGNAHIREMTKLLRTLVPQKNAIPQEQLGMLEDGGHTTVVDLLTDIKQLLMNNGRTGPENSQLTSVVTDQSQVRLQRTQQPTSTLTTSTPTVTQPKPTEVNIPPSALKKGGRKPKAKKPRDDLVNPIWSEDKGLGNGLLISGNKEEIDFWNEFVTKYLLPIRPTKDEKKKIADGLRDLRNSSAFGLIIINLLWMALNFMFQFTNAARFSIAYSYGGSNYLIEESVLGLGFVFLLLLLLVIQMFGMFIHRMGTLQHLLAITEIKICKTKEDSTYNEKREREDVIRRIQEVLKLPMTGDVGATTVPPEPATKDNNWGVTFAPRSNRGTFGNDQSLTDFHNNLDRTLKLPILGRMSNSIFDSQNRKTMDSVRHRLAGGNVRQKLMENLPLGKTLLPNLPPRGRAFHQPLVSQPNNWGFTQKELQNANLPAERDNQEVLSKNLGPMGRTLFQKSRIINQEAQRFSNVNNVPWSEHDVYRTVSRQSRPTHANQFHHL